MFGGSLNGKIISWTQLNKLVDKNLREKPNFYFSVITQNATYSAASQQDLVAVIIHEGGFLHLQL